MSKLGTDVRLGVLGATAGLFSVSIFLLIARVDSYYVYLTQAPDEFTYGPVEDLWWLPILSWHVLLSITATVFAHRYLTNAGQTPFILWQIVGVMVLIGWALTFLAVVGIACVMHGDINPVEVELRRIRPSFFGKYVSVAFACHVLYGSVIQASARHYQNGRQKEAAEPIRRSNGKN